MIPFLHPMVGRVNLAGSVTLGDLLLNGDEQSGTDRIALNGDEQSGTDILQLQETS